MRSYLSVLRYTASLQVRDHIVLWTSLTVISCFLWVGGAYHAANQVKVGLGGFVFASVFGLLMGAGNFWLVEVVSSAIMPRLERLSQRVGEWLMYSAYVGLVVWVIMSAPIGESVALRVLRLAGWGR